MLLLYNIVFSVDGKWLYVVNIMLVVLVIVIDVVLKKMLLEIDMVVCVFVYLVGDDCFIVLCESGKVLIVMFDVNGKEVKCMMLDVFIDVDKDLVFVNVLWYKGDYLFIIYGGNVCSVDFSGDKLVFGKLWLLLMDVECVEGWWLGGM